MENFYYNTLTINGITKICDNNIYLNINNEPINYQWHDFQLKYILHILDLPLTDKRTGLELTNEQMYTILKDIPKNKVIKSSDLIKDIEFGLVPKKIKNKLSINNLGGVPNQPLLLNSSNTMVLQSDSKFIYDNLIKTQVSQKLMKVSVIKWLINKDSPRYKKALVKIKTDKQVKRDIQFLQFGRLDWYKNSCYADTVLMMLLLPIFNNKISTFTYNNITNIKHIDEDTPNTELNKRQYNCHSELSLNKNINILNNIYKIFSQLNSKLNKGAIINSYKLLYYMDTCVLKTHNFSNKKTHDTIEFFLSLLSIYNIHYSGSNKVTLYKLKQVNENTIRFDQSLEYIFHKIISKNTNGIINYDIETELVDNNDNIIIKDITSDQIRTIFRTIKSEKELDMNDLTDLNTDLYHRDIDTSLIVLNSETINFELRKITLVVNLSMFLNHKTEYYPENNYHIKDGYEKIQEHDKYFIISKSDQTYKKNLQELLPDNDIAIKIEKYIKQEQILDANTLFFTIHRNSLIYIKDAYMEHLLRL